VAELIFARRFLADVAEWERQASPRDHEAFSQIVASIADDPALPGRAPSFYDPESPSYLYRSGSLLVHYRVTQDGQVEFLNLFS
jgi:hypothetical protein